MSAPGEGSNLLGELKESALMFWSERNARERTLLGVGAAVLVLYLLYLPMFSLALNGRKHLRDELPKLRQQSAQMQALAAQASELKMAAAVQVEPVSQESLAASLSAHGLKPKSLAVSDGLIRLQLDPVSFAGLLDWLNEQQKASHLTVVEANFIASAQLDMVNATLTLKQQRSDG